MEWKKILEIQYDAIQRSARLYIAILAGLILLDNFYPFGYLSKCFMILSVIFILLQNILTLFLIEKQRQICWKEKEKKNHEEDNKHENKIRFLVLTASGLATLFILVTFTTLLLK